MKNIYLSFIVFIILFLLPNTIIQAKNESFYEKIDFSNVDIIGVIKNKGKGE